MVSWCFMGVEWGHGANPPLLTYPYDKQQRAWWGWEECIGGDSNVWKFSRFFVIHCLFFGAQRATKTDVTDVTPRRSSFGMPIRKCLLAYKRWYNDSEPYIAYDNDPCLPGCGDRVRVKSAIDELFAAKSTPTVLLSARIPVTRPHKSDPRKKHILISLIYIYYNYIYTI